LNDEKQLVGRGKRRQTRKKKKRKIAGWKCSNWRSRERETVDGRGAWTYFEGKTTSIKEIKS
jgi:hypothetical protein